MSESLANSIVKYIEHVSAGKALREWLNKNYIWPKGPGKRDSLFGKFNNLEWVERKIGPEPASCYQKTSHVKAEVERALQRAPSFDSEINIVRFFVKEWGGVRQISDRILERMVKVRAHMSGPDDDYAPMEVLGGIAGGFHRFGLKSPVGADTGNVSSWSKYLSVAYPDWGLIYDSRVAYALNAIIYLYNLSTESLWIMPGGVNSKLGLIDIETLLVVSQKNERQSLSKLTELRGHRNRVSLFREEMYHSDMDTYRLYLSLVRQVKEILNRSGRVVCQRESEIEAFLFMVADGQLFEDVLAASCGNELFLFEEAVC